MATSRHVTCGSIVIFSVMNAAGIAVSGAAEIPGRRMGGRVIAILLRIGLHVGGVIPARGENRSGFRSSSAAQQYRERKIMEQCEMEVAVIVDVEGIALEP